MMVAVEMLFGNPHVFRVLYQQVAEEGTGWREMGSGDNKFAVDAARKGDAI